MKRLFYFLSFAFILISCQKSHRDNLIVDQFVCYNEDYPPRNIEKVTIDQGLWGDVWFWKGDFKPVNFGTICQVQRTIYIYELTELKDVVRAEPYTPFYSTINTKLVATAESDSMGFFQIRLEPGSYSLFVMEDTFYYSNLFDGHGAIYPVHIESGKVADVRFDITYDATY
jgi:hypothetical protein